MSKAVFSFSDIPSPFLLIIASLLSFCGIFLGGIGDNNPIEGIVFLSAGLAVGSIWILTTRSMTAQVIIGLTMFAYGVWWIILVWIETEINLITFTLLVFGPVTLVGAFLKPKKSQDKLNLKILTVYLIFLVLLAIIVYAGSTMYGAQ